MNRRKFLELLTGLLAALPFVRMGKAEPEIWGPGPIQRAWDKLRQYEGVVIDWEKIAVHPSVFPWDIWNPESGAWEQVPEGDTDPGSDDLYSYPDDVLLLTLDHEPGVFPGLDQAVRTGYQESE